MNSACVVELGEIFVKVLEASHDGTMFQAQAMGLEQYDSAALKSNQNAIVNEGVKHVQKALANSGTTKSNVHIIIPDALSYSRIVTMPHLNERELISAIKYQADQFIPMPLEDTNLDLEVLYEDPVTKKNLILIVAASKSIVENAQNLVEQAGLLPLSLQAEVSACNRLCQLLFAKEKTGTEQGTEGFFVFNMGYQSSSLYFYDTIKSTFIYTRSIPTGLMVFQRELEVNLNIDKQRAIELLRTFGTAQNASYKLETILAPALRDLLTQLKSAIDTLRTTNAAHIKGLYMFNNSNNFRALDQLLAHELGIPSSSLDLSPFFESNKVLEAYRQYLSYFVVTAGGTLA